MKFSNLFLKITPFLFFLTIPIMAGDNAPLVNADYYSTNWSTPLHQSAPGVLSNDYDDDSMTASLLVAPEKGELVLNPDGSFTYTPLYGYKGDVSFQYNVTDGENTVTGTAYLHLTTGNQAPVTTPDYYDVNYGGSLNVSPGVLDNDYDVEGDDMEAFLIDTPADADMVMNPDGSFLFEPHTGAYGVFTLTYGAKDTHGVSTGQIHITVKSPNAPVAVDDAYSTYQNTPVTMNVLANDSDGDNDDIYVHSAGQTSQGDTVVNADGTITFTPAAGFSGEAMFSYALSDGLEFAFATVWVNVIATANQAPVAGDDSVQAVVNTPIVINVLGNDTDPDGDNLTVTLADSHNTFLFQVNADQTITYTPPTGWIGPMEMAYFVSDGLESDLGMIYIFVGGNNAPIAVPDEVETLAGTPIVIDVMANDIEPDGQPMRIYNLVGALGGSLNWNPYDPITFTPDPGFVGDYVFSYTLIDQTYLGYERTASTTVTIHVVEPGSNEAPVAVADNAAVVRAGNVSISLLDNDTDADGDTLSVASVGNAQHGTVIWQSGQSALTYFPTRDFVGTDTIEYTVTDGIAEATATVTIQVVLHGGAPIAVDDVITVQANSRMNILDLADNDIDLDGQIPYILTIGWSPNGSLSMYTGPTGPFIRWTSGSTLAYTPDPGFVGVDTFTYTTGDSIWFGEEQQTGTVTIHVVE